MIDKLVKKYFSKNLPEKDKEKIYNYLVNHEDEFLNHFDEGEWNKLCDEENNKETELFADNLSNPWPNKSSFFVRKLKPLVAATLIGALLVTAMVVVTSPKKKTPPVIAQQSSMPFTELSNTGVDERQFFLPDSSVVLLKANSTIRYFNDYNQQVRSVYLNGEALFKVQKDASRKFTVFCDSVATTAIGTEFIVSNKSHTKVTVELISGKIVVSKFTKERDADTKYYLDAGNIIVYDVANKYFIKGMQQHEAVNGLAKNNTVAEDKTRKNSKDEPSSGESIDGVNKKLKRFNSQSLATVLEYLSQKYNAKIKYPTKDVSKIVFIGTINSDESMQSILHNIALMNNFKLDFDSTSNTYTFH